MQTIITYELYKEFADVQALSLYYLAKAKFKNSCIYNHKYSHSCKIFNIPRVRYTRYIKTLLRMGLCELHSGNMVFRSINKVIKENGGGRFIKFSIRKNNTVEEVSEIIYYTITKNNLRQQKYISTLKLSLERNKKVSLPMLKKAIKLSDQDQLKGKTCEDIMIASRRLGSLLGVSHTKANELIKRWIDAGWLNACQNLKVIKRNATYSDYINLLKSPDLCYGFPVFRNGVLFEHRGYKLLDSVALSL